MTRTRGSLAIVLVALMVLSAVAIPILGGGLNPFDDDSERDGDDAALADDEAGLEDADEGGADATDAAEAQTEPADAAAADGDYELLALEEPATDSTAAEADAQPQPTLAQDRQDAVEAGVEQGIELAQSQGVEVSQEQRTAALEGATASVVQHQAADVEQVQAATAGAVHGSVMQEQDVNATQVQHAVAGATDGALAQHQTVNASQLQSATWGATHGAMAKAQAQQQRVTVEQIQVATYGAATGAASEAGDEGVDRAPKIQEAAQGAAYGVLDQYQKITAEQRQRVTLEHVQHAAAGGSAGALEGSTEAALEQEQRVEVEQRQRVDVKQIQKAAKGAAGGALEQRQTVTIEQTQSAARGAARGSLKQVQTVSVEQIQRISITQIQEAAFGASKGAIEAEQSQAATVEQIQAAADGGAQGSLVQRQAVSITQIQHAAIGSAKGAVESAVQYQVVEVEQIQAAARGAGEGAVTQTQVVDVTQVQTLARGGASGALSQHQEASVTQIQTAARSACEETARVVQYQRISVTQLQTLTQETAADATQYAVSEGTEDVTRIVQYVEIEVVQKIEQIDELEGTATIDLPDHESAGERVVVDSVELSEGGFVAIYEGVTVDADPEAVVGVSDYLEAGEYEDLEIELDEPLEESQALVAVVHHDTNDDGTFDYVESDGAEDEPYVTEGGGPVLDGAFVTVAEPEPEPEATLSVSDQSGDGETLVVDEANASVDYTVTAEYDGERVDSEVFEANEFVEDLELDLEPPLGENATVDVSVRDAADDAVLANESIEYAVADVPDGNIVDSAPEAEGMLEVSDFQIAVGQENPEDEYVTLENVGDAILDFSEWTLQDRFDDGVVDSLGWEPMTFPDGFMLEPGESVTIVTGPGEDTDDTLHWGHESPVWNESGDDVVVLDGEGEVVLEESISAEPEEFDVEFVNCTRAEVTGSFEDGDRIAASTGFYTTGGFGNTIAEDVVEIGADTDAPYTGTIVFDVEADGVNETGADEVTVSVDDYGTYGTVISGISSPEAYPLAEIDHPNPDWSECIEDARPEQPELSVAETTPTDDGIDVTFGYDNPNDAPIVVQSEFVEGTTADEPPTELEPGEGEFTVRWTPESDDERLVWQVGMEHYDYDEPLTVGTATAGEIDPGEPAAFEATIVGTNEPVEQGEPLEVAAEIENVGDEEGEQDVTLALGGVETDAESVALEGGASEPITLTAATDGLEPGDYAATVATANATAETTVTIEESGAPAEFVVTDVSAPPTGVEGEPVAVAATITNAGDLAGTQTVTYSVDGAVAGETPLDLEGGETASVSFETALPAGESTHTIETDDDSASVTIEAIPEPEPPEPPAESDADGPGPADAETNETATG